MTLHLIYWFNSYHKEHSALSLERLTRLLLYRVIIAGFCKNRAEYSNTLSGQTAKCKLNGTYDIVITVLQGFMKSRKIFNKTKYFHA